MHDNKNLPVVVGSQGLVTTTSMGGIVAFASAIQAAMQAEKNKDSVISPEEQIQILKSLAKQFNATYIDFIDGTLFYYIEIGDEEIIVDRQGKIILSGYHFIRSHPSNKKGGIEVGRFLSRMLDNIHLSWYSYDPDVDQHVICKVQDSSGEKYCIDLYKGNKIILPYYEGIWALHSHPGHYVVQQQGEKIITHPSVGSTSIETPLFYCIIDQNGEPISQWGPQIFENNGSVFLMDNEKNISTLFYQESDKKYSTSQGKYKDIEVYEETIFAIGTEKDGNEAVLYNKKGEILFDGILLPIPQYASCKMRVFSGTKSGEYNIVSGGKIITLNNVKDVIYPEFYDWEYSEISNLFIITNNDILKTLGTTGLEDIDLEHTKDIFDKKRVYHRVSNHGKTTAIITNRANKVIKYGKIDFVSEKNNKENIYTNKLLIYHTPDGNQVFLNENIEECSERFDNFIYEESYIKNGYIMGIKNKKKAMVNLQGYTISKFYSNMHSYEHGKSDLLIAGNGFEMKEGTHDYYMPDGEQYLLNKYGEEILGPFYDISFYGTLSKVTVTENGESYYIFSDGSRVGE